MRADGRLAQPPERDELAARAQRRRDRPELVRDEQDPRVGGRLLEILQQRVGRLRVHQLGAEEQVHPPRGLERPHVEVAAQLADRVDPDLVAERLEHVEVGWIRWSTRSSSPSAAAAKASAAWRLPVPGRARGAGRRALPLGERGSSRRFASSCSTTASSGCSRDPILERAAHEAGDDVDGERASTVTIRCGKNPRELAVGLVHAAAEVVAAPLHAVALLPHARACFVRVEQQEEGAVRHHA